MINQLTNTAFSLSTVHEQLAADVANGYNSRHGCNYFLTHEQKWVSFKLVRPVYEKNYEFDCNFYGEEYAYHMAGVLLAQM